MSFEVGEETYELPPVLVADFRVLCYKIIHLVECLSGMGGRVVNQYAKCLWAYLLNTGPDFLDCRGYRLVVVDDAKNPDGTNYWRSKLLPDYKGTRSAKPPVYEGVYHQGLRYVKSEGCDWGYYCRSGWEADDWAGGLVSAKRAAQAAVRGGDTRKSTVTVAERPIVLWTVDSDWLQLVGDGVYWANTGPWEPRLRYVEETIAYAAKARTLHKQHISHPTDVVTVKMKFGDSSDNIPAGSPRYLIDLVNVPLEYSVREQPEWEMLVEELLTCEGNMVERHREMAKNWMIKRGYTIP